MLFTSSAALLGAALLGLAEAGPISPVVHNTGRVSTSLDTRHLNLKKQPCVFDMAKAYLDEVLYQGVCAPELPGVQAAVYLGLELPHAQVSGAVSIEVNDMFLIAPTVRINLGGVKIALELNLKASAAVQQSVELFASPALDIEIPGLLDIELGAAFGLDLQVGVSAAVDLQAGVYITLPELAFIEVNLLTKTIVKSNLEGLLAQALPICLGAGVDLSAEIDLTLGLRLRTKIAVEADLDIVGLEAGADVAIWVNLFDYTSTLVQTDSCALSVGEVFKVMAGVAVDLDVEVGDILDISLAPSVLVTLATAELAKICHKTVPHCAATSAVLALPAATSTAVGGAHDKGLGSLPTGVVSPSGSLLNGVVPSGGLPSGGLPVVTVSLVLPTGGLSGDLLPSGSLPVASGILALPTGVLSGLPGSLQSGSGAAFPKTKVGALDPTSVLSGETNVGAVDPTSVLSGVPTVTGAPGSVGTISAVPYGNSSGTSAPNAGGNDGSVTSTVTSTAIYTITSCAASVPNCPASLTQKVVTSTVIVKTTVCPATMVTATGSATASNIPTVAVPTPTGTPVTVTPCPTPVTSTYTAPSGLATPAPTVTIIDTTTVCPVTAGTAAATAPPSATYITVPTGSASIVTGTAPVLTSAAPVVSGAAPTVTGAAPVVSGAAPVVSGAAPTVSGAAPIVPGPARIETVAVGTGAVGTGAVGTGTAPTAGATSYAPTYVVPSPTAVATAGAGKVVAGVAAMAMPIFAALML